MTDGFTASSILLIKFNRITNMNLKIYIKKYIVALSTSCANKQYIVPCLAQYTIMFVNYIFQCIYHTYLCD